MTVDLRWHQDRVIDDVRRVMLLRATRAAAVVEREVRARVGVTYPPASRPGQPPRRRTGALQRSIRGTARITAGRVRVLLTVAAPYAKWLQRGTRHLARRPFLGLPTDARRIVDILSGRRR